MKFYFLISSSRLGGAQSYTKNYSLLISKYYSSQIIYGTNESSIFNEIPEIPCLLFKGLNIPFNLLVLIKLYKYFKNKKDSILIISSFAAGVNVRLVGMVLGIKTIYVSHGWSYQYKKKIIKNFAFILEYIFSKYSYTLCISKSDLDIAINRLKIPKKNILFIRNRYLIFNKDIKSSFLSKKPKNILFVGRNEYPKRLDLFIELSKKFIEYNFFIVGVEENELAKLLPGKNVYFLGKIQNFNNYEKYDLFCLFSNSEGLPLSGIEAGANGLPLMLSNVGGCSELIFNGNGVLVNNNIINIEKAFKYIISNFNSFSESSFKIKNKFILESDNNILLQRSLRLLKYKLSIK